MHTSPSSSAARSVSAPARATSTGAGADAAWAGVTVDAANSARPAVNRRTRRLTRAASINGSRRGRNSAKTHHALDDAKGHVDLLLGLLRWHERAR